MHTHVTLFRTNFSQRCDADSLRNHHLFASELSGYFSRCSDYRRNEGGKCYCRCYCCCCWPLVTLNILRAFAGRTLMKRRIVCYAVSGVSVRRDCTRVSSASQSNVKTQLSIAVNCMKDTNRSMKLLRTAFVRVCSSQSASQPSRQRAASKAYMHWMSERHGGEQVKIITQSNAHKG